jgi:hypothetical protein
LGIVALAGLMLIISCSKDDPPPKSGIRFEITELEVFESDGTIDSFHPDLFTGATGRPVVVKILLDRAPAEAIILQYSLSGSATRINPAGPYNVNDFSITEGLNTIVGTDKITIEKGATEATIIVTVFEDYDFEIDDDDNLFEEVIIRLVSVVSGPAQIGEQDTFTLKIKEDDIVVILDWEALDNENSELGYRGDVDMDLLLHFDNEIIWGSVSDGNSYEAMNIPAGFPAGTYGLSYTYYSGTSDDLDVYSLMFSSGGTLNGNKYVFPIDDPLVFSGHYTLENINEWGESSPPKIVQTMVKNGINYASISNITAPPDGGSRKKFSAMLEKDYPDLHYRLKSVDRNKRK